METKRIQIKDYNYNLPDERIAKYPLENRDMSKLLVYRQGNITQDKFCNLSTYLPKGALMIFNNTKVIQARMFFRKETGAQIEIFLLEPVLPADYEQMFQSRKNCSWYCLVGNLKKWKEGELSRIVSFGNKEVIVCVSKGEQHQTGYRIDFSWNDETISFAEIIDAMGELPIPPYLNRNTEESDKTTYQTVYSKIKGSVAAPTAGLHFTERVLNSIDNAGIIRDELTLHVGAGTFKPVKSEEISGHDMHSESVVVKRSTLDRLIEHKAEAIAVGTTSVRTLESLYYLGVKVVNNPGIHEDELHVNQWEPYDLQTDIAPLDSLIALAAWMDSHGLTVLCASTQIIIAPGYDYKIVKMLVTNFHQPQSTLLLLVSAFVKGNWRSIYDYAIDNDFRFLSYGDSSLIIP